MNNTNELRHRVAAALTERCAIEPQFQVQRGAAARATRQHPQERTDVSLSVAAFFRSSGFLVSLALISCTSGAGEVASGGTVGASGGAGVSGTSGASGGGSGGAQIGVPATSGSGGVVASGGAAGGGGIEVAPDIGGTNAGG